MFESLVRKKPQQKEQGAVHLKGFPHGLNTVNPAEMIEDTELSSCIDFKLNPGGALETRPGFRRYTTVAASGEIRYFTEAILSGTSYQLASDDLGNLYYLSGASYTEFTLIDTVTSGSECFLFPYNDICYVLDGGHAKFVEDTSEIKMAYDAGEFGTQYDGLTNNDGFEDTSIAIGDGTNVRAAVEFTSQNWDTGYTIPITQVDVKLSSTGSPTGVITCKLRKVSDDSVLATKDFSEGASDISSTGTTYSVQFSDSDITTEMSPGIGYYCSIEYSGGDASNYISLATVSSGTYGAYYTTEWNNAAKDPLMKIYPKAAPKAFSGCVSKNRPWLAEDSDNPGYVWFGNLSHLDYSTTNGGGYISSVDENRNSYPIGAIADLYGDLWVYGTQRQPFLCKLQGSSPSDFALPLSFQKLWATRKCLISVGSDLWNATEDGVDSLYGVQSYGDVRTFSYSDRIRNLFSLYYDSDSFIGFNPDGQVWIKLSSYDKVLIANINSRFKDPKTGFLAFPWSTYSIPEGVSFTAFGYLNSQFMVGSADGHLYKLDKTVFKDHINNAADEAFVYPEFETGFVTFPLKTVDLIEISGSAFSKVGGFFELDLYLNGQRASSTVTFEMSTIGEYLTIEDLTMAIEDAEFYLIPEFKAPWKYLNINCWSIKLKVSKVQALNNPVYFHEFILPFKRNEK